MIRQKKDGTWTQASGYSATKDYSKVENFDKAKDDGFRGWICHHKLETHNSDGERRSVDISSAELIALGMYYDRPPEELIYMRTEDHTSLHKLGKKTKPHTDAWKRAMSEFQKTHPNKGRFKKGRVDKMKGTRYYKDPNTLKCKRYIPGTEPTGWVLGRYTPWQSNVKLEEIVLKKEGE